MIPGVDETEGAGTANTALVFHANKLLALNEGDLPYEVRVMCEGLVETVGRMSGLKKDGWDAPFTAHPKLCPKTGELAFFGYRFDKKPYVVYGALDAKGNLMGQKGLDLPQPLMLHDAGLTERFMVFQDVPLRIDGENMVKNGDLLFSHVKTAPLRFALVPRIGHDDSSLPEVQWFDTLEDGSPMPSLISMHVGNAWEEDEGNVVCITCCTYARFSLDIGTYSAVSGGDPKGQGDFTLVKLNRTTGRVTLQLLTAPEYVTDFPRVHDSVVSLPTNNFSYLATISKGKDIVAFDGFLKVDHTKSRTESPEAGTRYQSFGPDCLGGECVFVPRKGSTEEDDGYVMTFVYHKSENKSRLHIYSAKTLESLCQIQIPTRVPFGFHGLWLTNEQVESQRTLTSAAKA